MCIVKTPGSLIGSLCWRLFFSFRLQIYLEVGEFFREKFGELAGWAHSILFAAELSSFRKALDDADMKEDTNDTTKTNNSDNSDNNNTNVIEGVLDEVAQSDELKSARKNLKRKFDEVD